MQKQNAEAIASRCLQVSSQQSRKVGCPGVNSHFLNCRAFSWRRACQYFVCRPPPALSNNKYGDGNPFAEKNNAKGKPRRNWGQGMERSGVSAERRQPNNGGQ